MASIDQYTQLITSEHNQQPNYTAMIAATVQPLVDGRNLAATFFQLYDLDLAVGQQLDVLGQWIGISRSVATPISGVFFSFDTTGLGWDQGSWLGPFSSGSNLILLSDDQYRLLLRAKIAINQWDGTVPNLYAILAQVFALTQVSLLVQDNQDMTMTVIILTGGTVDPVILALITGGYIVPRPAGVRITGYSQEQAPIFGWDTNNAIIQGWDTGQWFV